MRKKIFTPDAMFSGLHEIPVRFLQERGITWLALDLDNTITHDCCDEIPEHTQKKLDEFKDAGISLVVISNNKPARVERFAEKSGLQCVPEAKKPRCDGLVRASKVIGKPLCEGAFVGDQLFTDIWAGKRAGMTALLVEPFGRDLGRFVRFKRQLERLTKAGRKRYAKCR